MIPKDKKTYQQDPANYREALRELRGDEAEGADIVMVKPGMPYLDIIRLLRDNTSLPVSAYHVSGMRLSSPTRFLQHCPPLAQHAAYARSDCALVWAYDLLHIHCPAGTEMRGNGGLTMFDLTGEYAMIKAAALQGWLNERETVLEALLCMKRAGADLILSYFASDAAKWMAGER